MLAEIPLALTSRAKSMILSLVLIIIGWHSTRPGAERGE
eukprot:SAG31_NODE_43517_length_266_cov_9.994012_1_plen_38_part_10